MYIQRIALTREAAAGGHTRQVSVNIKLARSNWSVLRPFLEMTRVYRWPSMEMLVMLKSPVLMIFIVLPNLPFASGL